MGSVWTDFVNMGWLLLCIGTVLPQDVPPSLGVHLDGSINVLEEVFAGKKLSSSSEALSCDCLRCGLGLGRN